MKKLVLLLGAVLLLTGCKVELSTVESGYVSDRLITEDSPHKAALTPLQLQSLEKWFENQQTGWTHKVTDTPLGKVVLLKHPKGKSTFINLRGHELWVGNYFKVLTEAERADFLAILELGFAPVGRPAWETPR